MIRLAFSTNAFKKNTLEDSLATLASIGYPGVEIMADVPHALPENMDPARRKDVLRRIHDAGQVVSNVNAFTLFACGDTYHPTWIEHDPARRAQRIDHTKRAVELAAQLGSRTVSLQPGGPLIGTGLSYDEAAKRFADALAAVVPAARAHDVILAIEPEPGLFIQTSAEYRAFKTTFFPNEASIQMNCDTGHLFCVGEDPAAVIREMPADIAHVHLEDIAKNRVHQHLTPGNGAMDFPAIFKALEDVHYAGWTTVELYPYETTAAGVAKAAWDHLRPMIQS